MFPVLANLILPERACGALWQIPAEMISAGFLAEYLILPCTLELSPSSGGEASLKLEAMDLPDGGLLPLDILAHRTVTYTYDAQ